MTKLLPHEHIERARRGGTPTRWLWPVRSREGTRALALASGISFFSGLLFLFDVPVAEWVHRTVPVSRLTALFTVMKMPGHFAFTLAVAVALVIGHGRRWRAAALVCLSGVAAGGLCALAKWVVGRTRPFKGVPPYELHPFRDGIAGLFRGENLSFPSGHTCLAFATAASLALLLPRWGWAFFAVAIVVAAERVLQGSHYLGDVTGAAALGVVSACIVSRLLGDRLKDGTCSSTHAAEATG